jgi:hypothetical protein
VLDQLSDTRSIGHLSHEDLEAYANGRLASARLSLCQAHLDSCDACRAELEDVRNLRSELASFVRPETNRSDGRQRKRSGGVTLLQAGTATTVLAAAACAVLWWRHESPRVNKTLPAPPVVSMPTRDTRLANELAVPLARTQADVVPQPNTTFALLSPLGETTSDTRPQFSWQPLPGAIRYSVAIVDARLHPVQRSPALRTTTWRPRRPLRRGRTYLWQVTATVHGGSKIVASEPGKLTVPPGRTPGGTLVTSTAQ